MRCFVLALLIAACGAPNVGASCSTPANCDNGLTCSTAIAGGYCTRSCTTTGSTAECPDESVCDTVSGIGNTCVKICKAQADCRSDLGCNGVSGSNLKACKPN